MPTTSSNPRRRMPTAATLIASNSGPTGEHITCVYCGQGHTSGSCTTITDVNARKEILLKAGRCYNRTMARAILDSGSQRTYITSRLRDELNLPTVKTKLLQIKTFGSTKSDDTSCDVVQVGIETRDDGTLSITALVVPFIFNPLTTQPIDHSGERYDHLWGLELADSADTSDILEVDVLIGSDSY